MSTQQPATESRIAPQPTPRYGAPAVVECPTCGTIPADSLADAEESAAWCRDLEHGPARAREV